MENESSKTVTSTNRRFTVEARRDPDGVNSLHVELFATVEGSEYRVAGYGLKLTHKALAERLGNAWVAGAIGDQLLMLRRTAEVVARMNVPEFFVFATMMPLSRRLNAELRKAGF